MPIPSWVCEQCGIIFVRKKGSKGLPRFCGNACNVLWRKANNITAGCFKKGQVPWNKNMRGMHFSPATEFKPGHVPATILPVGSMTIRTRKRDGNQRAWIKIAEPNIWEPRVRINWEYHNGPIPKGHVVHRKDGDSLNDDIGNLELLSRAEHLELHRPEFDHEKRRRNMSLAHKERRESQYDSYYWEDDDERKEYLETRAAGVL